MRGAAAAAALAYELGTLGACAAVVAAWLPPALALAAAVAGCVLPSGACAIEDTWTPPPLPGWLEAPDDAPSVKARASSLFEYYYNHDQYCYY